MTDEEKKAIEVLNYIKNKTPFIFWYEDKPYNRKETINTVLNLIEKQSKEIEELNKSDASKEQSSMNYYILYKELVDRIKAKIEEIENTGIDVAWEQVNYTIREQDRAKIQVLQSLLEKE